MLGLIIPHTLHTNIFFSFFANHKKDTCEYEAHSKTWSRDANAHTDERGDGACVPYRRGISTDWRANGDSHTTLGPCSLSRI